MKTADRFHLIALAVGAFWIASRCFGRSASIDELIPTLAAILLFVWMAGPLRFAEAKREASWRLGAVGLLLITAGALLDLVSLLSIGWTMLMWRWMDPRLEGEARTRVIKLLPLICLALPWLNLDFPMLGWWCRLSSASATGLAFQAAGFPVEREGTRLLVAALPFEVSPACSGMKSLQSILIAGTILSFIHFSKALHYWVALSCLPLVAWLANVVRVFAIVIAALAAGPEFAAGWFHEIGGWLAVTATFFGCWFAATSARRCKALCVQP